MTKVVREFRQEAKLKGKTKRWVISQEGPEVSVRDGLSGGKMKIWTTTTMEAVNVGKANEKDATQCAIDEMERRILLKCRQGYQEVDPANGQFLQEPPRKTSGLDSFQDLPQNLRFYKPLNSMNSYLQKLMDSNKALWRRKRDGNMHIYVVDENGNHQMYSSTTTRHQKNEADRDIIERYPKIESAMRRLNPYPKTILLGEICCVSAGGTQKQFTDPDGFDVDRLDFVNGVRGALTETAQETQIDQGYLGFCIWDIAFWNGKDLLNVTPAIDRFAKAKAFIKDDKSKFLTYPETAQWDATAKRIYIESLSGDITISELEGRSVETTLIDLAKDYGWEGWVVVDPNATFGDQSYNFRGKPERPKYSAKLKPKYEADFIVRYDPDKDIGVRGKGKKSVGVGSVACYFWDPETSKEVYVGKCGGGLDDEDVVKFADKKLYPMVWKLEFANFTKASVKSPFGSLQFPEFVSVRDDKPMEECTPDQRPRSDTEAD